MSDKEIIINQGADIIRQKGADIVLPVVDHATATLNRIFNALPLPMAVTDKINGLEQSVVSKINLPKLREAFNIPAGVTIANGHNFQVPQGDAPDEPLYKSLLGTPVYASIDFLAGQYETNISGVFKSFGPLRYDAVLINVSQAKRIVKTEIQGRNGTVKEYIGDDDYHVTVNGILTAANGQSPASQIIDLKKMLDAPVPIQVASVYLQNLGIFNLVVDSYDMGQQAGSYSYQTFSISFISDQPQELRITNV